MTKWEKEYGEKALQAKIRRKRGVGINPSIEKLLNTDSDCIGKDILTISRNLELREAVSKALSGYAELMRSGMVERKDIMGEG